MPSATAPASTKRRVGRPATVFFSLRGAAEEIARLADLPGADGMERAIARAPLSFFPHARGSGTDWKIPERDIMDWLGDVEFLRPSRFARKVDLPGRAVRRMIKEGRLNVVWIGGHERIPRSEFYRLVHSRTEEPRPPRSFFSPGLRKAESEVAA